MKVEGKGAVLESPGKDLRRKDGIGERKGNPISGKRMSGGGGLKKREIRNCQGRGSRPSAFDLSARGESGKGKGLKVTHEKDSSDRTVRTKGAKIRPTEGVYVREGF